MGLSVNNCKLELLRVMPSLVLFLLLLMTNFFASMLMFVDQDGGCVNVFLVPAHPGSPTQRAVKWLLFYIDV